MPILTGQDLTQLLHGLVQLQLFPAQAWMDGCCARVLQVRQVAHMYAWGCVCFSSQHSRCTSPHVAVPDSCLHGWFC
jgi:hypothetical protein